MAPTTSRDGLSQVLAWAYVASMKDLSLRANIPPPDEEEELQLPRGAGPHETTQAARFMSLDYCPGNTPKKQQLFTY